MGKKNNKSAAVPQMRFKRLSFLYLVAQGYTHTAIDMTEPEADALWKQYKDGKLPKLVYGSIFEDSGTKVERLIDTTNLFCLERRDIGGR